MASLNLIRLTAGRAAPKSPITASIRLRRLHQSPATGFPRKDSQNKDSINTEATEYSKSGTDDQAAKQDKAAFDPNQTDPETEKETAGAGNEESGNPLEVSPANKDVSKQRHPQEGGAENSSADRKQSGQGSPNKAKKV